MPGYSKPDDAILIALGSNLPGQFKAPQDNLFACLGVLSDLGLNITVVSRMWRSTAWPNPDDPEYINAVAIVECDMNVLALLSVLQDVEVRFGRTRQGINAPRTVDLDLIAYGRVCLTDATLTLPHPRAHERGFVMGPLCDILPDWRHPVTGLTAEAHYRTVSVGTDARPIG
ncbi:MAG: 2-amino-4-hydroxy-6-hydroxymethyldihydropteridine diphosphokinase [Asticcacaulis sp.]